jgi:hypothetical protein
MAMKFSCPPSQIFGLTEPGDHWLAIQVNRAVFRFGTFIEARRDETVETEAPKNKRRHMIEKPKYKPEEIREMIYGPLPDPQAKERGDEVAKLTRMGLIDPTQIEAEDDYIPPSFR